MRLNTTLFLAALFCVAACSKTGSVKPKTPLSTRTEAGNEAPIAPGAPDASDSATPASSTTPAPAASQPRMSVERLFQLQRQFLSNMTGTMPSLDRLAENAFELLREPVVMSTVSTAIMAATMHFNPTILERALVTHMYLMEHEPINYALLQAGTGALLISNLYIYFINSNRNLSLRRELNTWYLAEVAGLTLRQLLVALSTRTLTEADLLASSWTLWFARNELSALLMTGVVLSIPFVVHLLEHGIAAVSGIGQPPSAQQGPANSNTSASSVSGNASTAQPTGTSTTHGQNGQAEEDSASNQSTHQSSTGTGAANGIPANWQKSNIQDSKN